jgi:hypothetical protein
VCVCRVLPCFVAAGHRQAVHEGAHDERGRSSTFGGQPLQEPELLPVGDFCLQVCLVERGHFLEIGLDFLDLTQHIFRGGDFSVEVLQEAVVLHHLLEKRVRYFTYLKMRKDEKVCTIGEFGTHLIWVLRGDGLIQQIQLLVKDELLLLQAEA